MSAKVLPQSLRFLSTLRIRPSAPFRKIHGINHLNIRQSPFHRLLARNVNRRPVRHILNKRFNSNDKKPPFNPTPGLGSPEPSLSLTQRLRKLSREYGWSALGVYLLLTALDFPFCFLAVRWVGSERIGHWESVIIQGIRNLLEIPFGPFSQGEPAIESNNIGGEAEEYPIVEPDSKELAVAAYDHGYKEAEKQNTGDSAST